MRYRARKKTKAAEPITVKEDSMEEGVVLFCCAEKIDEKDPQSVIEKATEEVIRRLDMVKAKRVMVYPYAHLANDLSEPKTAIKVLKEIEKTLREQGFEVKRAAFGWYKELELKSKGHPLSDLSMTICPGSKEECNMFCPVCHNSIKPDSKKGFANPEKVAHLKVESGVQN